MPRVTQPIQGGAGTWSGNVHPGAGPARGTHLVNLALDHGLHRGMLHHLPQDTAVPTPDDQHLEGEEQSGAGTSASPTQQAPAGSTGRCTHPESPGARVSLAPPTHRPHYPLLSGTWPQACPLPENSFLSFSPQPCEGGPSPPHPLVLASTSPDTPLGSSGLNGAQRGGGLQHGPVGC